MPRMTLYNWWRSSSSHRVRIALAMKGIDYEYAVVRLLDGRAVGRGAPRAEPDGLRPVPRGRRRAVRGVGRHHRAARGALPRAAALPEGRARARARRGRSSRSSTAASSRCRTAASSRTSRRRSLPVAALGQRRRVATSTRALAAALHRPRASARSSGRWTANAREGRRDGPYAYGAHAHGGRRVPRAAGGGRQARTASPSSPTRACCARVRGRDRGSTRSRRPPPKTRSMWTPMWRTR